MEARTDQRRIIYATFATSRRSGGVHVQSEHVRLLRSVGEDAWLWLPGPQTRPDWFDADVPTLVGPTLPIDDDDLLVLPEVPVVVGQDPAPGGRKAILNQNHFFTFAAGQDHGSAYPGWSPDPVVWAVSQESRDVLAALFPHLAIVLLPNVVAADLFVPRPESRPAVAWFSRKRPLEARLVHRLLAADERLAGVDLREITDEPWPAVAEILGAATVFIAFGHSEGFGLPVAEALAAGCLVAGYDGGGGYELFEAPGAWRVPEQRPLLLIDRVADLLTRRAELQPLGAQNRAWVMDRHAPQRTLSALRAAVDDARARPGTATVAVHPSRWLPALPPQFFMTG
jgi:hypothetical protein